MKASEQYRILIILFTLILYVSSGCPDYRFFHMSTAAGIAV
jgi:hypothetical protein